MPDSGALTVVMTTGLEDGGRKAAIALGVALAALAEGTRVHLFLSIQTLATVARRALEMPTLTF